MSCPTCDHAMSRLGCQYSECAGSWHCPRCGTLKIGHEDGHVDILVPALVERCREFQVLSIEGYTEKSLAWHRLGIAEAIHKPEDRRPA